ncbi:MAG TPA: hypothetical protein VEP91_06490 [Solirubrobacterales bacterium]|nr:hypothetical protein [Solirubrobacterales bacterium]
MSAAGLFLVACGRSSDTRDPTPPTIRWILRDLDTGAEQSFDGSGRTVVPEGHALRVILKSEAPGGIRRLRLDGEENWTCYGSGDVAQGGSAVIEAASTSYTSGQAPLSTFLIRNIVMPEWECNPGLGNPSGSVIFKGKSENFSAHIVKGSLTICDPRGCR